MIGYKQAGCERVNHWSGWFPTVNYMSWEIETFVGRCVKSLSVKQRSCIVLGWNGAEWHSQKMASDENNLYRVVTNCSEGRIISLSF